MRADLTPAMRALRRCMLNVIRVRHADMEEEWRDDCRAEIRSYIAAIRILEMANGTRIVKGGGK